MVLCKYFMEGYCKFGNQCRYEHVNPYDNYDRRGQNLDRPSGTSVLKASITATSVPQQQFGQQSFQDAQTKPASPKFNIQDLLQIVAKDIVQAEKGGQWPLSSYSPVKDLQNMPDLMDYSPEELRWESYMAIKNGGLPLCQALVQQLHANVAKVNNKLKKKDTAYAVIERWLHDEAAQQGLSNAFNVQSAQMSIPSNTQSAQVSFSFSLPQQPINPLFHQQTMTVTQQPVTSYIQQQPTMEFQQQPASPSIFGGTQVKEQARHSDIFDKSAYSLVEELSESELEAFKNGFVFGRIPTKPPPRELCG